MHADLNITADRKDCLNLASDAAQKEQPMIQVENLIHFAKFVALERMRPKDQTKTEEFIVEGKQQLKIARKIIAAHPSTRAMSDEVEAAEKMLRESTFYTVVTSEEKQAIYMAMARDFRGTGHWYYCVNGHPVSHFTISSWTSNDNADKITVYHRRMRDASADFALPTV